MRKSAAEYIRHLEMRIARLERPDQSEFLLKILAGAIVMNGGDPMNFKKEKISKKQVENYEDDLQKLVDLGWLQTDMASWYKITPKGIGALLRAYLYGRH